MTSNHLASQAGGAVVWKGLQMVATRLISLVRLLVLARLLLPEDFGLFAIGLTSVQTILAVTDFGMLPALVQHPDPSPRHYDAAWTVGVSRALLITTSIVIIAPWISILYSEPSATSIIRMLALKPLLDALASIKIAQLTRHLKFSSLAIIGLLSILVDTTVSIILASRMGAWALVAGVLTGAVIYLSLSYLIAPYKPRFCFDRLFTKPLIHYGRWVFVTGIIIVSGNFFLNIVISRQLGAASLGLYYLSFKLAYIPLEIAAEVIGSVAFPVYARLQNNIEQSARAFRMIFSGMASLLVPIYGILIAVAPMLERTILGDKWVGTGPTVRILSLVGLFSLLVYMVVPVLKGFGQPYKVAVLEFVQSTLLIALAWVLVGVYGLTGAALTWLPAIIVSQVVSGWMVKQILKRPFDGILPSLLVVLLVTGLGILTALSITSLLPGVFGLILAVGTSGLIIGLGQIFFDRLLHLGLMDNLVLTFPQARRLARIVGVR